MPSATTLQEQTLGMAPISFLNVFNRFFNVHKIINFDTVSPYYEFFVGVQLISLIKINKINRRQRK